MFAIAVHGGAGALSPADYREFVLPYARAVVQAGQAGGIPVIYFSTGTGGMCERHRHDERSCIRIHRMRYRDSNAHHQYH